MAFSSPPNPKGYNESVRAIPAGRVATYGQVARLIPPPEGVEPENYFSLAPRWVGGARASCPDDILWQRVINSQGRVSARSGMGPLAQRKLLEDEGVTFDDKDHVDLARFSWAPEGAEGCDTEGDQPKLF